jgi:rare lipoprotein A (peptidoglycan hydrolase)
MIGGRLLMAAQIDLSAGAAAAIGMGGTGRVHLKIIR